MDERESHKIAQRAAGDQKCLFGTAEQHCGQPAIVHVLQIDSHPTMSCPDHAYVWAVQPIADAHQIGPNCGLPAMRWLCSCHNPPGRCASDLDDAMARGMAEARALGIR